MEDERLLLGCLPLFRMDRAGTDMTAVASRLLDQAKRNLNAANSLMTSPGSSPSRASPTWPNPPRPWP